jgi:predicted  nucleic acid-binding Zn-ribbon protein
MKENEVSAEWFFKLKEFDSLGKMRIKHLKEIQEQQERLTKLNVKRQEQIDESSSLRSELLTVQQAYFDNEKKMNTCEEQAARLQEVGGDDKKIANFKKEAVELENSLFALLEQTESIQLSLNEKKTFLTGLEKTFKEIESEVNEEIKIHQTGITQADMRMDLIKEELPKEFQETLDRTLKKNLAVGSFTRIENGSCYFCRYKISRTDESEIDQQFKLKTCPQCSRIFLPYNS